MKLIFKIFALLIIASFLLTCKDNPVGPDDSNATPGRRDYTWEADTINNPYQLFYNIWGDSPSNVWSTGSLMSDGVYHYNGEMWSLDNRVYISDPDAIWGYGNDLWIGNDKGCIWKFTGENYKQELKDFNVDGNLVNFVDIVGKLPGEIYAVGSNRYHPIILKYDGLKWNFEKALPDSGGFNKISYSSRNDKYYLRCPLFDYSTRIYEYEKGELKIIYDSPPSNRQPGLSIIDGYVYIITENEIKRYFNGKMELIFKVNDPNFGGTVWGRNRNDIFIRMQDGLAHYNGTDWQYLFKSIGATALMPNCTIFDKDIFIPAKIRTTGYPIIYHGKLK